MPIGKRLKLLLVSLGIFWVAYNIYISKAFISSCKELNGKEFSIETLRSVNGYCSGNYSETGKNREICTAEDVNLFRDFIQMCGQYDGPLYGYSDSKGAIIASPTPTFENFYRCYTKFNENRRGKIGHQGRFWIHKAKIGTPFESTTIIDSIRYFFPTCRIEQIDPYILSVPSTSWSDYVGID